MYIRGREPGQQPAADPMLTIDQILAQEPWMEDAVCSQTDPEIFFPEKGGSTRPAIAVCKTCGVQEECLQYALEREERFGVWGGLSDRQRRKLLRERKAA